jgi:hypothetical protein
VKYFITNGFYEPLDNETYLLITTAATEALRYVISQADRTAVVVGMESDAFDTTMPSYICLNIQAGSDLNSALDKEKS